MGVKEALFALAREIGRRKEQAEEREIEAKGRPAWRP
jgi:hypothetical protein